MRLSILTAAAIAPLVSAHYFFNTLIIDGQETNPYQYVRSNTRPHKYNPTKWINPRDDMTPDMPDFRCNKGAFTFANETSVAEVKAGSKLALKLGVDATIAHPGPAFVYMSKAPDTVRTYEGDGDWFKIHEEAVCDKGKDFTKKAWCMYGKDRIEFTLPADLPDGEYLVRPEHIGLHVACNGQAEFFNTCAHVKIVNGGHGSPGPTVKFPGAYKQDDPSFNFSIYGGYKEYPMPGPEVWTGGIGNSTAGLANIHATNATSRGDEGTCKRSFTHHRHGRH
ncbi:hypothetical protein P170DRAFT_421353 [Aspergillus steynii IBT 23096]|uniref:AA9 family lytic polysaccharide monooxygenase n=1 Tax=Aspergillus steynii IBT 23096 TaxID=1392250 RepID=A0A2I2GP88_9EURO|nr:uncharacterized protein P170DRAFT_421353 [Aspergillus steynii IBT 23096]PLB54691.1 hypothetical protein P170DRAFT_421353 [Aspergillus steynii IBT 23096]